MPLNRVEREAFVEELADPKLDGYTVVQFARKFMDEGRDREAISRLNIDADKFILAAPVLYSLLRRRKEIEQAEAGQWRR